MISKNLVIPAIVLLALSNSFGQNQSSWTNPEPSPGPGQPTKWSVPVTWAIESSPAIGSDGTVYVNNITSINDYVYLYLYSINPVTQQTNWTVNFGNIPSTVDLSSPTIDSHGTIYVSAIVGSPSAPSNPVALYAINPTNGYVEWTNWLGAVQNDEGAVSTPAVGSNGTIYVTASGCSGGVLFAVNPNGTNTCSLDFLPNNPGMPASSPVIGSDGTIYCVYGTDLYAVTNSCGTNNNISWSYPISDEQYIEGEENIYDALAIGSDGTIYVGSELTYQDDYEYYPLLAINPPNGTSGPTTKWPTTGYEAAEWNSFSAPVIGVDGTVYACADGTDGFEYLVAFNPQDGSTNWATFLYPPANPCNNCLNLSSVAPYPAIASDGTIYVAGTLTSTYESEAGILLAVSPGGTGMWYATLNNENETVRNSSPAISRDGTVYFGSVGWAEVGALYAVASYASLANSPWPMFGKNPAHTACQSSSNICSPYFSNGQITNSGGTFSFNLTGPPNSYWIIYNSSDLINWTQVIGVTLSANGTATFTDKTIGWEHYGFYTCDWSRPIGFSRVTVGPMGLIALTNALPVPTLTDSLPIPSASAAPALVASQPLPSGGALSLSVTGTPGTSWSVYSSSDLVNWTSMGEVTLDTNGTATFTDSAISGVPCRFYTCSQPLSLPTGAGVANTGNNAFTGTNAFIANQLDAVLNTLDGLFNPMPDGSFLPVHTVIEIWNTNNDSGFCPVTWEGPNSGWSGGNGGSTTLEPGKGAILLIPTTSTPVTVSFVGLVREGQVTIPLWPGYGPRHGWNGVSSMLPEAGGITTVLGYQPLPGDEVLVWNGVSGSYVTNSYTTTGWNLGEPVINVGESFLIDSTNNETWPNTSTNSIRFLVLSVTTEPINPTDNFFWNYSGPPPDHWCLQYYCAACTGNNWVSLRNIPGTANSLTDFGYGEGYFRLVAQNAANQNISPYSNTVQAVQAD